MKKLLLVAGAGVVGLYLIGRRTLKTSIESGAIPASALGPRTFVQAGWATVTTSVQRATSSLPSGPK